MRYNFSATISTPAVLAWGGLGGGCACNRSFFSVEKEEFFEYKCWSQSSAGFSDSKILSEMPKIMRATWQYNVGRDSLALNSVASV